MKSFAIRFVKRLVASSQDHHTADFKRTDETLIVRRGQPFRASITLERAFSPTDTISLDLRLKGQKVSLTNGSHVIATNKTHSGWQLTLSNIDGKKVDIQVHSPPSAIVGRYEERQKIIVIIIIFFIIIIIIIIIVIQCSFPASITVERVAQWQCT